MQPIVLKAHFDGHEIRLDDTFDLPVNAQLIVTVLPTPASDEMWRELARSGLARAYADSEPDYPLSLVAEPRTE